MYSLKDPESIPSPALLFYPQLIAQNLRRAVEIAGSPDRLRPHVKTHKTREIVRLELDLGITKHKCATLAEADMLAECGAGHVLVAYPLVGPNLQRFLDLIEQHPKTQFAAIADHPDSLRALANAASARRLTVEAFVDLNVGMNRTGVALGSQSAALYRLLTELPGVKPGGLHVYDGQNTQPELRERTAAAEKHLGRAAKLRMELERCGLPVPRLILGGTPTFAIHARANFPGLECSPGTMALYDVGYASRFADITGFTPAAVVFTRVISRPTSDRVTFDVGTKAIAADPAMETRCRLADLPEAKIVAHNEEHLVVETPNANRWKPGDHTFALPAHVCPTVALYPKAITVENGHVTGEWAIAARDR
jgi:D-serine deaminase-like pyridoxal phosphate-dependent protein